MTFNPAAVLPHVRCPVLAVYGAADEQVPVERSVAILADRLPALHRGEHAVAVLPGAGHMLFANEPRDDLPRTKQLSPAFLPLLADFLSRRS